MGTLTTLAQDITFYGTTIANFGHKKSSPVHGNIVYAGSYWPDRHKNTLIYNDVDKAIREARSIIVKAYLTASSAVRGDAAAGVFMKRWFGERNTGTGPNDRDWWKGALAIMGAIEDFIVRDVNVYYRGDDSLLGKANDYPGRSAQNLVAYDLSGFAESMRGKKSNIIGLCKLFFRKQKTGGATMNLRGKDSVGGTLVHELSHNICSTLDHKKYDDSADCYGTGGCLDLAEHKPHRAFYNADNIEYFCEDVSYNLGVAPKPKVQTGATQGVKALGTVLAGAIPMGAGGLPFSPQTWKEKTARFGHTRSGDLHKLDQALETYAGNPTPSNRQSLKTAFNHWYTHNPKERTARNKDNCVERLKTFLGA